VEGINLRMCIMLWLLQHPGCLVWLVAAPAAAGSLLQITSMLLPLWLLLPTLPQLRVYGVKPWA
jgi:hypothetical protein